MEDTEPGIGTSLLPLTLAPCTINVLPPDVPQEIVSSRAPVQLQIHPALDEALTKLFRLIIRDFVLCWYGQFFSTCDAVSPLLPNC